jgi:hypothetical protein
MQTPFVMAPGLGPLNLAGITEAVGEVFEILFGPLAQAQAVIEDAMSELGDFTHVKPLAQHSLGGADQSASLAWHHDRAMQVYADTLIGMSTDLKNFHDAFAALKKAIEEDDTNTEAHLNTIRDAVVALGNTVDGSSTSRGA